MKITAKWMSVILCIAMMMTLPAVGVFAAEAAPAVGTVESQTLGLEGVSNARQLGGYVNEDGLTVKDNMLLRTGQLVGATEADVQKLQDMGVTLIIDFRSTEDMEEDPDVEIPGAALIQAEISDPDNDPVQPVIASVMGGGGDSVDLMIAFIQNKEIFTDSVRTFYTSDFSIEGWKTMYAAIMENDGNPFIFHCSAGKDRTGFAAALLLAALGVDEETILNDYELTNDFVADENAAMWEQIKERTDDPEVLDQLYIAGGVSREFLGDVLPEIDAQYGSLLNFEKEVLGLTDDDIAQLREWYLE